MDLLTALRVIDGYGLTVTKVGNARVVAEIRNGKVRASTGGKTRRKIVRVAITDEMLATVHDLRGQGKNWRECREAVGAGSANGLQAAYNQRFKGANQPVTT